MSVIVAISFVILGLGEPQVRSEMPIVEAVRQFNDQARSDPIGATQQPLTVDEVVAAIRFWNDPAAPVSPELLASFRDVAESGVLPENAVFEALKGYDPGGDHLFDVWSVRIRFQRPDNSSYAFILRETMVGSRTLQAELERLKASTGRFPNGDRMPGWRRLESRIEHLEKRIADQKKPVDGT